MIKKNSLEYRDFTSKDNKKLAEEWRESLFDNLGTVSDEITELYLEGKEIPIKLIQDTIRKGVLDQTFYQSLLVHHLEILVYNH